MSALESIEEALTDALTLAEGVEFEALRQSRLTRVEILRLLSTAAETVASLEAERVPEIDRAAWAAAASALRRGDDRVLWSVLQALAPQTLIWLRSSRVWV